MLREVPHTDIALAWRQGLFFSCYPGSVGNIVWSGRKSETTGERIIHRHTYVVHKCAEPSDYRWFLKEHQRQMQSS